MDFRVFSRNISENMHARCVREDTKQALKGNLQADGVQSCQTLFVRYCLHSAFPKKLPYAPFHRQTACVRRTHTAEIFVFTPLIKRLLLRKAFRSLPFCPDTADIPENRSVRGFQKWSRFCLQQWHQYCSPRRSLYPASERSCVQQHPWRS